MTGTPSACSIRSRASRARKFVQDANSTVDDPPAKRSAANSAMRSGSTAAIAKFS